MSTRTITYSTPPLSSQPTAVVLSDPTGTYGVETSAGSIVVAAGTNMTLTSTTADGPLVSVFEYAYTFTEPAVGLGYNCGSPIAENSLVPCILLHSVTKSVTSGMDAQQRQRRTKHYE
ncbi:MAG TPA: hypothetical protein VHY37_07210 [Tepidisphaeraceae bacterium]|jgi:hypothetical protein|nr:hypothetical protein [Tepidisphaeraceae bacterium]